MHLGSVNFEFWSQVNRYKNIFALCISSLTATQISLCKVTKIRKNPQFFYVLSLLDQCEDLNVEPLTQSTGSAAVAFYLPIQCLHLSGLIN